MIRDEQIRKAMGDAQGNIIDIAKNLEDAIKIPDLPTQLRKYELVNALIINDQSDIFCVDHSDWCTAWQEAGTVLEGIAFATLHVSTIAELMRLTEGTSMLSHYKDVFDTQSKYY